MPKSTAIYLPPGGSGRLNDSEIAAPLAQSVTFAAPSFVMMWNVVGGDVHHRSDCEARPMVYWSGCAAGIQGAGLCRAKDARHKMTT